MRPLVITLVRKGNGSMRYREFGRLGWRVSEIGYGMWGVGGGPGGWTGSDDERHAAAAVGVVVGRGA